jgi:hypothetical protein
MLTVLDWVAICAASRRVAGSEQPNLEQPHRSLRRIPAPAPSLRVRFRVQWLDCQVGHAHRGPQLHPRSSLVRVACESKLPNSRRMPGLLWLEAPCAFHLRRRAESVCVFKERPYVVLARQATASSTHTMPCGVWRVTGPRGRTNT